MKSPLQRAEKTLLASTVLLCVPALVLGWFYQKQNELPPTPVAAKPVPPSPNALDWILNAAAQSRPLSTARYSPSGACVANGIDWEMSCQQWTEPRPYTRAYDLKFPLRSKQKYLQLNQSALALWRKSLDLPLMVPDRLEGRAYHAWNARFNLFNAARTQARADWQKGNNAAALQWLLAWHQDICRSALSFYDGKHHPNGIFKLNATSQRRAVVLNDLERLAPHLNAPQLRRAALKLQENRALLPSRVAALQVSKAERLNFAYRVCERNDLRCYYEFEHPETVIPADMSMGGTTQLRFRWANKKAGLRRLAAQWDWLIAQAHLPIGSQKEQIPDSLRLTSSDVFRPMEVNWNSNENRDAAQIDAREAVLLSSLAARAFALDNGRNPRDGNELVPRYLKHVEADPFNRAHPLIYSAKPKTYSLFVLGQPIFKAPLPRLATPFPTPIPPPPTAPVEPGEDVDPPPIAVPELPQPLGFLSRTSRKTLPFLLYSVGPDGRDDGGMDFKAAAVSPWKANWSGANICDDILAPLRFFSVAELEGSDKIERDARSSNFGGPAAPP